MFQKENWTATSFQRQKVFRFEITPIAFSFDAHLKIANKLYVE